MIDTNRPRVFVSSTIRGFADLRSALKFWLEEMGAEVRLSEYVDFQREPNDATYDACFQAISDCDYYILLVGGDKGSEFQDGVSVTQQEYRVAARLAKEGRIKPVIFIRKEVMTALSEREALLDQGLDAEKVNTTHSRALNDPAFVQEFVKEIKQTEYEREGVEGRAGAFWYYQFAVFREIIDALRVNLHLNGRVQRQALLANLGYELEQNLTVMLAKLKSGEVLPIGWILDKLRESIVLDTSVDKITLTDDQGARFVFWQLPAGGVSDKLQTQALREAVLSGEFLIYNQANGSLRASPIQELMEKLLARVGRLQQTFSSLLPRESSFHFQNLDALSLISEAHKRKQPTVTVPTRYIASAFLQCNLIEDITNLSVAILKYIEDPTAPLQAPSLNPDTPYKSQEEGLKKERVTPEDVRAWLPTYKVK